MKFLIVEPSPLLILLGYERKFEWTRDVINDVMRTGLLGLQGRYICCINSVTSPCKNLFNILEFIAEALRCHMHHFQSLTALMELAAMFPTRTREIDV
jgi:hypothetical protein